MAPPRALLTAMIGLAASSFAGAAVDAPALRIASFSGDRAAAISYTFDDGLRDQYTLAVPMLNELGLRGTFFVIPGKISETVEDAERRKNDKRAWGTITWNELRSMAEQGHEIASHTWTHPNLSKLSPAEIADQIDRAADAIAKNLGRPALTVAFPFNARTPEIEAAALRRHVAFRSRQLGAGGEHSTTAALNDWADRQARDHSWGVVMAHAIANGYAAFTDPEILRDHLRYVKSREKDIWVDTFANVARYQKERDRARLSIIEAAAGRLVCTLKSDLDTAIYSLPLTVAAEISGAGGARAERDGRELPVHVGGDVILIEAVPADAPITLAWK